MSKKRVFAGILFALYLAGVLWLLLFRRIGAETVPWRYNLQPLDTVKRYLWVLHHSDIPAQRRFAAANLMGNITLFLPLGILFPVVCRSARRFARYLFWTLGAIALLELCQLVTGLGVCDVDDVLLNMVGALTGWMLWKSWRLQNNKKSQ